MSQMIMLMFKLLFDIESEMQSIVMSMFVCLSAGISWKPPHWNLRNFLYMLPVTLAQCYSGSLS